MSTPSRAKVLEDPETSKKNHPLQFSNTSQVYWRAGLTEHWQQSLWWGWLLAGHPSGMVPVISSLPKVKTKSEAKNEDRLGHLVPQEEGFLTDDGHILTGFSVMFFWFFLWAQQTSRKISMFGSNTSSLESLLEMPWESDICSQSTSCSNKATATPWFQMQKKWLILRRPQWRTKKELAQERCHVILK